LEEAEDESGALVDVVDDESDVDDFEAASSEVFPDRLALESVT
jgi:hypothetical protein